jgi:glyoxylase-like metal-dependent hydrolase (beta-lactamase superfamily II)
MRPLTVGRLRTSAVVERAGPTRPTWLLPDALPEAVERHRRWLAPHFLDDRGRFLQSIHSFVVQAPDFTALIDTCVGNDKDRGGRPPFHMMRTAFLDDLKAAGFPPESIDLVLCTHLHVDHVGWNTRLDHGRWVPTFPRARHLFARREWEHWSAERTTTPGGSWPTASRRSSTRASRNSWRWTIASRTRCGWSRRRATRPDT